MQQRPHQANRASAAQDTATVRLYVVYHQSDSCHVSFGVRVSLRERAEILRALFSFFHVGLSYICFWATVCKFVKRFALSYHTVVCLS